MKRYAIIGCLWFLMASAMIHGNARAEIDYEIRYDSNTKQTYELKQKIQDIYSELVRGVHKESYILMVLHNKELFAYRKDLQADWKQNQLVITEGDGKGDTITGTLRTESVCVPEESRIPATWLNFIAFLFMCKYNKNRRMRYENH